MISHVMTLANGIIGVSVLAMPFCFKQCGIVLATLVLLLSSALSRLACHFLIKSAVMSRRRNFEFLAFHAFGPMAKLLVELCIIGFLLGTCIAFFVVVGDLGPQIVGEMIDKDPGDIRTSFLITTGIFIVLPLGLLRNIDSLASVSTASIAFYICLVLKVIAESTHHIFAADWLDKVHYWRPGGMLQCLPIFALALFCQTQLFEIYEAMPNATLEKMNEVVRGALNICTVVYLCVGFFGYIGFCTQSFTGNILMSFEPSMTSEIIKIGFVLSVAFSFPLVIFPCRASLNSLLFRRGYAHENTTSYISEARFRCLTTFIVTIALIAGVLIPNIEFVLGIVGSTIGVIICLIFPAAFFVSISTKNTNERLLAQIILFIGVWIMILGTYANLYALEQSSNVRSTATTVKLPSQMNNMPQILDNNEMLIRPDEPKQLDSLLKINDNAEVPKPKVPDKPLDEENARQEPPVPVERLPESEKLKDKQQEAIVLDPGTISPKVQEIVDKINMDNELIKEVKIAYDSLKKTKETNDMPVKKTNLDPIQEIEKTNIIKKNDVIAVDAIKKEESELAADKEMSNADTVQRHEELRKTLEEHRIQQKEMIEEQKELLKDIKQQKQELAKLEETGINQQKSKTNVVEIEDVNNNLKEVVPNKVDQDKPDKLHHENIETDLKVDLNLSDKKIKPSNEKNNEPQQEIKSSQDDKVNKNNKIPVDVNKMKIENKLLADNEIPKNVELPINSNLSRVPADAMIRKSDDPIIQALTKQSNKISNENDVINIPKDEKKNDVISEDKKIINNKDEKNNEYSIPIVLKMNNNTKRLSDQKNQQKNQSKMEVVAAPGRDILEEHQREKRMTEIEEMDMTKINLNETTDDHKNNLMIEKAVNADQEKICTKKEKDLQNNDIKEKNELKDESNSENLIKASAYLSKQDVIKEVSIDLDVAAGEGSFVKLKKRDLKAVKYDNGKEK